MKLINKHSERHVTVLWFITGTWPRKPTNISIYTYYVRIVVRFGFNWDVFSIFFVLFKPYFYDVHWTFNTPCFITIEYKEITKLFSLILFFIAINDIKKNRITIEFLYLFKTNCTSWKLNKYSYILNENRVWEIHSFKRFTFCCGEIK